MDANIIDLTGLEGATNLTELWLAHNSISDISAVSGLTNLAWLSLDVNNISDISPVSRLTNLTGLYLDVNSISDISAVSGLTNLDRAVSWGQQHIESLAPWFPNTGLGAGDEVDVRGNPLNAVSVNTHIPTLQGRGVNVHFDAVTVPTVLIEPATMESPSGRRAIDR